MANTQPPLHLSAAVSRWLAGFILATHFLAGLVLVFMPTLPWWLGLLLCVPVGFSLRHFWRLHIARSHQDSVLDATFYSVDNWRVHTVGGSKFAHLDDSSFLQPWLCVLNLWTQRGKVHTLILLPDSLPSDVLRRLRVRVKFSTADLPAK
jgi:hypothetical protein